MPKNKPKSPKGNNDFEPIIVKHCMVSLISGILSSTFAFIIITGITIVTYTSFQGTELNTFVPVIILGYLLSSLILALRILYMIDRWKRSYYHITKKAITYHHRNLFFNRSRVYKIEQAVTVISRYGIIGRLFNCGTVKITDPTVKDPIFLRNVGKPKRIRKTIEDFIIRANRNTDEDIIIAR